jgi:hypothetical protein
MLIDLVIFSTVLHELNKETKKIEIKIKKHLAKMFVAVLP